MNKQQLENKPKRKRIKPNYTRMVIIITFIMYMLVQIVIAINDSKPTFGTLSYNDILDMANKNEIKDINITNDSTNMVINTLDGKSYDAVYIKDSDFLPRLLEKGVKVSTQRTSITSSMFGIITLLPTSIIMIMVMVYISNTIIGGNTKMFTILKSSSNTVTFEQIQGLSETKQEVKFIVEQLKNWKKLGELGARPCKGVLLYGPPGTGKTMIAKAIAKEANVAFISASGSDFNEVFVGVGAGRVRTLWDLASTNAPCIIFIDEIDCLGKKRKVGDGGSNENNQTLNALLQKMDGLNESKGIMVIGATNRKDDLDTALVRPGRFDRQCYIGIPDNKKDRDEIVSVYLKNKLCAEDVSLSKASKIMVGLSGASIEYALNEAVYTSLQNNRDGIINLRDIDEAVMKLLLHGVKKEHKSNIDEEITAWHEAGHTIMSLLVGVKVSKVSIIPYSSGTGGVTVRDIDDEEDRKLKFKSDFESDILIYLAGKIAEDLKYNQHTQGCSEDLKQATQLIYDMVTKYGFGQKTMLTNVILTQSGIDMSKNIIEECDMLLNKYNQKAIELLNSNMHYVGIFANILLDKKTIVSPTLEMLDYNKNNK